MPSNEILPPPDDLQNDIKIGKWKDHRDSEKHANAKKQLPFMLKLASKARIIGLIALFFGLYTLIYDFKVPIKHFPKDEKNFPRAMALLIDDQTLPLIHSSPDDLVFQSLTHPLVAWMDQTLQAHRSEFRRVTTLRLMSEEPEEAPIYILHFNGNGQTGRDTTLMAFLTPAGSHTMAPEVLNYLIKSQHQFLGTGLTLLMSDNANPQRVINRFTEHHYTGENESRVERFDIENGSWIQESYWPFSMIGVIRSAVVHIVECDRPSSLRLSNLSLDGVSANGDLTWAVTTAIPRLSVLPIEQTLRDLAIDDIYSPHHALMRHHVHSLTISHRCSSKSLEDPLEPMVGAITTHALLGLTRSLTGVYEFPHHGMLSYILATSSSVIEPEHWIPSILSAFILSPLAFVIDRLVNANKNMNGRWMTIETAFLGSMGVTFAALTAILMHNIVQRNPDQSNQVYLFGSLLITYVASLSLEILEISYFGSSSISWRRTGIPMLFTSWGCALGAAIYLVRFPGTSILLGSLAFFNFLLVAVQDKIPRRTKEKKEMAGFSVLIARKGSLLRINLLICSLTFITWAMSEEAFRTPLKPYFEKIVLGRFLPMFPSFGHVSIAMRTLFQRPDSSASTWMRRLAIMMTQVNLWTCLI